MEVARAKMSKMLSTKAGRYLQTAASWRTRKSLDKKAKGPGVPAALSDATYHIMEYRRAGQIHEVGVGKV